MLPDSTNPRVMANNIKELDARSLAALAGLDDISDQVEALGTFSATEVDTGMTGLNGNIYRKIFFIESLPNNATSDSIPHGINNLGYVYRFDGVAFNALKSGTSMPFAGTILPRFSSTGITIQTSGDYSTYSGIIIMEYEKEAPTP